MTIPPSSQTRLVCSLLANAHPAPVPRSLHDAARSLDSHTAGSMVSFTVSGNDGQFMRASLTALGRSLAAELGLEAPVHRSPEDHRREAHQRETDLHLSQWGRLPGSWGSMLTRR